MKNNYLIICISLIILLGSYIYFKKSIEAFQDAYIINLDSRQDRLDDIIKTFKDIDLDLYKLSAIHDSVGWKGCGYSHVSLVKMAKEKGLPSILIMEDDCIPRDNFTTVWPKIQAWLDSNLDAWDMYAGGNRYYHYHPNEVSSTVIPICAIDKDIKLYYTKFVSAQFYYLNSSAYDAILAWEDHIESNEGWVPIDLWPDMQKLRVITSVPFITLQKEDYSNIEKVKRDYTQEFYTNENALRKVENNLQCNIG